MIGLLIVACSAVATMTPVPSVALVEVSILPSQIATGAAAQATALVLDSAGNTLTNRSTTWSSSDTKIATVEASSGLVRGVAAGTATIVATSGGKSGHADVTVTTPAPPGAVVATVTVSLASSSIVVGSSTMASAVALDAASHVLTGRTISFSSSNASVAKVDASSGAVTAVAVGSASIIATCEGKTGSATITVQPVPVAAVTVSLGQSSIMAGASTQASAVLKDASGNVLSARTVSWSSTNTGIATVDAATGSVRGVAAGSADIVATSEGKSGKATLTVTAVTTGGTLLFQENFEDTNFGGRGWYDVPSGGMTSLSTTDHIAGSAHSLQVSFAQGALKPNPGVNARHLFPATDAVYVRYWIKHSANWVGSNHNYHPHEFYILSTLDDAYAGPSFNYLTTYIEDNWMSDGGHPLLQSQDAQNIDVAHINQDLTAVTEQRAVSGCNGNPDNTVEISCYQSGSWNNVKVWRAAQPAFVDATGPKYKGDWHKVEVYYKLNSIVNGIGQRDGVAQYWVDGVLYIDRHDLQFRTGAHPTLQFNQFIISPYIGDGSPVSQTLWYDDLVVMTGPPAP